MDLAAAFRWTARLNLHEAVANHFSLAFKEEGIRCAARYDDSKKKVMVMGNHGVMVIGATFAESFNRWIISSAPPRPISAPCRPGGHCGFCPTTLQKKPPARCNNVPIKTCATWPI